MRIMSLVTYLAPANEVCEGYVFTSVCLSKGGGVWQTPSPWAYGQQASGTHPTGMQSCCIDADVSVNGPLHLHLKVV